METPRHVVDRQPVPTGAPPARHPRAAVVLCLGLLAWYLWNLPGSYFVDEPVYVRTGQRMLAGEPYHNPTHILAPLPKYPELAAIPQSPRNGVSNVARELVVYRLNASVAA